MSRVGIGAFKRCDVKVVEFKDYVYPNGVTSEHGNAIFSPDPSSDTRRYAGSAAILHCPRTEDSRVQVQSQFSNHPSRLKALKSVSSIAGELLCHDCRFSCMTPAEVSIDRAKFAEAEAERIKAYGLRAEAIQELEERGISWHIAGPEDL